MMSCCSLYAGLLRTPIEIQEYQSVPDAMGGQVEQWVTVMRVRTHWKHASMYEQLQAMKLNAGVIHRVYMRYSDTPTPKHRMWYKGQAYQIHGVVVFAARRQVFEHGVEY